MQHGQRFYRELAAYYDELFPVDPEAVDYVRSRATGGRPVLDAACGTGAHVAALEGHGIEAYGIDNSPEMIEIAQLRQPSRFKRMDMREVADHHHRPFSLVYSIGNSVSHLPLLGDVARFLTAVYEALAPEGVTLLQIIDVSDLDPGTVYPLPTLSSVHARMERAYTVDGSGPDETPEVRFDAQLYLSGEKQPRAISQRLLGLSPKTLRVLMRDLGFRDVRITEGFTEIPYGSTESRIAVVTGNK
ncbi:MAG: class I SAM-dependent methyltransferase [Alkalispirochaetaceae bacterium]